MDISLKISKSQDPHNTAIKNISSVLKKNGLQVMITKDKNLLTIKVKGHRGISSQHRL